MTLLLSIMAWQKIKIGFIWFGSDAATAAAISVLDDDAGNKIQQLEKLVYSK